MAINGTLAGPLFNLLIGLGVSLFKQNLKYGPIEINFFNKNNISSVVAYVLLFINLILNISFAYKNNFVLYKSDAYRTAFLFLLYLVTIFIITFVL